MKAFYDHWRSLAGRNQSSCIALAARLEKNPEPRALEGKVLSLLFLSPSLRTLASFQAAMTRLGGGSFVISPDMSIHGLETRPGIVMDGAAAEHIREAVPVIASYGDAMGMRAFAQGRDLEQDLADTEYKAMASLVDKPLINMESAVSHPCQSLADWKTMDELGVPRQGGKFVLSWAYHPRALPLAVPISTLQMACMRGMDVTVLRPGRLRAAGVGDGASGRGCRSSRRQPAGNRREGRSAGRRADYLCEILDLDAALRRQARRRRAPAAVPMTGAWTSPGSTPRQPMRSSCTACPCGAAWSWPIAFSTGRAAW